MSVNRIFSETFTHRLEPIANGSHGHWSKKAKTLRAGRAFGNAAARSMVPVKLLQSAAYDFAGARVTIIRSGPRRMDVDNLYACCKGTIDGIAKAFGVDDGKPWWTWRCDQRLGPYAVIVEIELIPAVGAA